MTREPFNVLVIPFVRERNNIKFCIFKRADMNIWQFIAGGGESGEEKIDAARREAYEESGIDKDKKFFQLKSMCYIPANIFSIKAQKRWGDQTIVIPVFVFAVEVFNRNIILSKEHTRYLWVNYNMGSKKLYFDLDKTGLYELNELLKRNEFYRYS